MFNLNVRSFGFVFVLISFVHIHGAVVVRGRVRRGVRLILDVQCQGGGKTLELDGQGGGGGLKIREFPWTSYEHCHLRFKSLFNKN